MRNAINWFEIPAANFDRAVAFYSAILGAPIKKGEFGGLPHGFFPADEDGVAGAIIDAATVPGSDANPGHAGPVLYLNAGDQLEAIIARVEAAGGQVLAPPTVIGPQGSVAIFRDTEGNRVGLHQPPM